MPVQLEEHRKVTANNKSVTLTYIWRDSVIEDSFQSLLIKSLISVITHIHNMIESKLHYNTKHSNLCQ